MAIFLVIFLVIFLAIHADPLGRHPKTPEVSAEEQIKALEKKVSALLDEAYTLSQNPNHYDEALVKAKEAYKKDRQIAKLLEQLAAASAAKPTAVNNPDGSAANVPSGNLDLTYCVLFNLANRYHDCRMYPETIAIYTQIVKNKQFAQSSRLRVNIGNVYSEQGNYASAVKMYRMALDQLPLHNKALR